MTEQKPPDTNPGNVNFPSELVANLQRHLATQPPKIEPDHAMIKPVAREVTEETVGAWVINNSRSHPEVAQRLADADEAEARCQLLTEEHLGAKADATDARDWEKQRVPRSHLGAANALQGFRDTAFACVSWSGAGVAMGGIAAGAVTAFELTMQVGFLNSSPDASFVALLTCLGFCFAFSVGTILASRHQRQVHGDKTATTGDRRRADRWANLAWLTLGLLGLFLGVLHIDEWGVATPLKLVLTAASPMLLAKSCVYIEQRVDHHRAEVYRTSLVRNPKRAALRPEIQNENACLAELRGVIAMVSQVRDQVTANESYWRARWWAVRNDYCRREQGLDDLHAAEDEVADAERKRRQAIDRLRLYDTELDPEHDDSADNDNAKDDQADDDQDGPHPKAA